MTRKTCVAESVRSVLVGVQVSWRCATRAVRGCARAGQTAWIAGKALDWSSSVGEESVAAGGTGGVDAGQDGRSRAGSAGGLGGDAGQAVRVAGEAPDWVGGVAEIGAGASCDTGGVRRRKHARSRAVGTSRRSRNTSEAIGVAAETVQS